MMLATLNSIAASPTPASGDAIATASPLVSLVNDLPNPLTKLTSSIEVATPSKEELARQWFAEHPDDSQRPGRELQESCLPAGVRISYVTWNKVKKELAREH